MKLQGSIDRRDRRLLMIVAVCAICATVLIAIVHPEEEADSFTPSTYSSAPHGAKAALLLLQQLGYHSEQSERPLDEVAAGADAHTVLILAEPVRAPSAQEAAAVRRVLEHGGRVLAAGFLSATAIPEENLDSESPPQLLRGICEAQPLGFSSLTRGGNLLIRDVHEAAGDGETEALVSAGLRKYKGVDADNVAVDVDERSSGIAGIDGRVCLDIDHRRIRIDLARHGRNYAEGDRVAQTFRTAEGENDLSLADIPIERE